MIFLIAIVLVTLNSCNKKQDVNAMLQNQETKSEIYKTIADTPDYMEGFMETLQNNKQAMQMMRENQMFRRNMMNGKGMQMMMNDSMMMQNMMGNNNMRNQMMQNMMNDSTQMNTMMKMMHQQGMMNYECMQSCMKMMNKKGMMKGNQ